jgi:hypothetical protein
MSDTQRLDWLERNPDRLVVLHREGVGYKFSVVIKEGHATPDDNFEFPPPMYSQEYDTLRDALDEGMKRVL